MQISMEEGLAIAGGVVFVVLILIALVWWCDRGDGERWGHSQFTLASWNQPRLKPP